MNIYWNVKYWKDDAVKVKVYSNFENGGFVYGDENLMVNHLTLAEDPEGKYEFLKLKLKEIFNFVL